MNFKEAVNLESIKEQHRMLGCIIDGIETYGHCFGHAKECSNVSTRSKEALDKVAKGIEELEALTDDMVEWYGN